MKTNLSSQTATELTVPDAKRIRHEISTGLSFIDTAVRNIASSRPNVPEALKMHAVGTGRLRTLLSEIDGAAESSNVDQPISYEGIKESVFTAEHPEVSAWTKKFHDRVEKKEIFANFGQTCPKPSSEKAIVVGVLWHRFSEFMPWFICQAAAQVSSNEKRHYVIQTAFEELGMRDSTQIHPDMFWNTAELAGVSAQDKVRIRAEVAPAQALSALRDALLGFTSDAEVLGILLGLEVPAVENIETIFTSLAHSPDVADRLNRHTFFRLHRQIEIEQRFASSPLKFFRAAPSFSRSRLHRSRLLLRSLKRLDVRDGLSNLSVPFNFLEPALAI